MKLAGVAAFMLALAGISGTAQAQANMTFFVTSVGPGRGADLGGIEGADRHCAQLAATAGRGSLTWRAYLSTQATGTAPAVNARDRIGRGPWANFRGEVIARDVDDLHSANNNLNKLTDLNEKGEVVNGRGDTPNRHDVLTGSTAEGRAFPPGEDKTCGNWTKSGAEGSAMVGHHDRMGLPNDPLAPSWNASHLTRGCNPEGLRSTGGDGLLYCFAAN